MAIRRKLILSLLVMLVVILATGAPASTAGSRVLKLALLAVEGHPVYEGCSRFATLVSERTSGRIKIELYPGGQLGDETTMRNLCASGAVDLVCLADPVAGGVLERFEIMSMPFIWRDREHLRRAVSSPVYAELADAYLAKSGLRILAGNWQQGARQLLSRRPIRTLEDMKGLKIRLPYFPSWEDAWRALGALSTPIAFTEVYLALQQGVVDAVEPPLDWQYTYKFHEVAKYVTLTEHVLYCNQLQINEKVYQKLTPEDQEILKATAVEVGEWETNLVIEAEKEYRKKMEAAGVKFLTIDRDSLRKALEPVYQKYRAKWGAELFDAIAAIP